VPTGAHGQAQSVAWNSLRAYAEAYETGWHVTIGVDYVGHHPDGQRWVVCPDLMVHTQAGSALRPGYMWYAEDGPPELIMEVLEARSWRYETDMTSGKGMRYLSLGVQEYLVFDPYAEFLGEHICGWRSLNGEPRPWRPDGRGRYWSRTLGLCFLPLPYWRYADFALEAAHPLVPGILDQSGAWIGVPREHWPVTMKRVAE